MKPFTASDIHSSFVNMTAAQIQQVPIPGLHEVLWDEREYLGWRDPAAPLRGYIVSWIDGRPVGIQVRTSGGASRPGIGGMCSLCHTPQPMTQVNLFTAPKAGRAGENGDTIGTYICHDLACSLIIRMAQPHLTTPRQFALKTEGLLRRVQNFTQDVMKTA